MYLESNLSHPYVSMEMMQFNKPLFFFQKKYHHISIAKYRPSKYLEFTSLYLTKSTTAKYKHKPLYYKIQLVRMPIVWPLS